MSHKFLQLLNIIIISSGKHKFIELLLRFGANIEAQDIFQGETPLHIAAREGEFCLELKTPESTTLDFEIVSKSPSIKKLFDI